MYYDIPSIKPVMSYDPIFFKMYEYTTKYADLPDEELREHFHSRTMEYIHKFPKVTDTLKYIGKLRISWSLDLKYNKNIDLIFFPEDNPYINYAILYAKGSPKILKDYKYEPRIITEFNISYDINYDFVKEVFKQSELSPTQQERFFNSRFGGVFIPMEIEFEWYHIPYALFFPYLSPPEEINKIINVINYDEYLKIRSEWAWQISPSICIGIIKSYKILPSNTPITFPKDIPHVEGSGYIERPTYAELLTPLPTSALAYTYTNIDDFIVNVRDKPDVKEGKIVAQLLSQRLSPELLVPTFKKLGRENVWWDGNRTEDEMLKELISHYKIQKAYYTKEKANLINPLDEDEYLVLVWNIESNGWAKVWILRMIDENSVSIVDNKILVSQLYPDFSFIDNFKRLSQPISNFMYNYKRTFLEHPSRLKLYEGYIHTSGLEYFIQFGGNYIQK